MSDAGDLFEIGLRGQPEALAEVRTNTGNEIISFAYPAAAPSPQDVAVVRAAGFKLACTMKPGITGWRTDPFLLPRTTVAAGTSMAEYKWMVRFGSPAPWHRGGRR
jgi:hypothetical protein